VTKKERKRFDRLRRNKQRTFRQVHTAKYAAMVEATNPFIYPKTYKRTIADLLKTPKGN
jgi:uncharacterized protein YjeT (DUF2065 family)